MAIRAKLFHQLGGFNEDALAVAYNDVDLCLRTEELGYRTVCTSRVKMIHQESMSRKITASSVSDILPKNQANLKLSDLKRERQESSWMRKRWSNQLALYTGNQFL
jgi:GT2 family glycosyltransferase